MAEIRSPVRQDQRAWLPAGVVGGQAEALASQLPVRECGEVETTTTSSTTSTTSTTTTSTTSTTTTSTTTTTTPTTTTRPDAPTDVGILAVTGHVGGVTPPSSTTSSSTPSTSSTTSTTAPGTSTTFPAGASSTTCTPSRPRAAPAAPRSPRCGSRSRMPTAWPGSGSSGPRVQGPRPQSSTSEHGAGTEWGTAMQFPSIAVPGAEEHRVPTFELEVTDRNGVLVRTAAQLAHRSGSTAPRRSLATDEPEAMSERSERMSTARPPGRRATMGTTAQPSGAQPQG